MSILKRNVLGINIFQGWIRAYRTDRSGKEIGWSADKKANTDDEMRAVLKEAVAKTRSKGLYASILLDDILLRNTTFDIPLMGRRDLNKYIQRKVDHMKEFDHDALVSYTQYTIKKRLFVSVFFLPKLFAQLLIKTCGQAGVYLVQIMPLAAARSAQFKALPIKDDEMAAFVINMYDKVSLIVGKTNGAVLSGRSIKADLEEDDDVNRIIKEIRRSILYSKQHYGENVSLIKVSDRFDEIVLDRISEDLKVTAEFLPQSKRFYWVVELLKIPFKDLTNLISRKMQRRVRIRKYTRFTASIVIVLWLAALIAVITVEYLLYKEGLPLAAVKEKVEAIEQELDQWEKRHHRVDTYKRSWDMMKAGGPRPVPAYFIGYLGNILPDGLILKKTSVKSADNGWEVALEGISTNGHSKTALELRAFSNSLRNGPFHLRLDKGWYEEWLKQMKKGPTGNSGTNSFLITGSIL